ncbi:sialate O-acetylesterase [Plebeiibacterium marinum]|uniref:Sialate O-acetylesterase n=1 Tax=Plebeiibacterium marinum TaxID=2992111 RepID=A0AAE3MGK2_9BACT|nr:sialate O-acetylesterase [Plebeiobacterium marinum]MCW3806627.1 sialate O-acetylesterase [Plebeiobacterium marinum]
MKIKSRKTKSSLVLGLLLVISCSGVRANISLPAIFGNHMVMQQNAEVKLWGWGKPLEGVKVKTSWSADTLHTVVTQNGNWSVSLQTPSAGETHEIAIQGYNKVEIKDVLMGEVWLCSGQSNMEWSVDHGIINGEEAAREAENNEIRLFHVVWKSSPYPCIDLDGQWVKCTPETMRPFSAIGYFFGKELNKKLNCPVGLISSNWGGTPIEAWIPEYEIRSRKKLNDAANKLPHFAWAPNEVAYTYNAMIAPLLPFSIKGVLWYQGEANVDNAYVYTDMLELLVKTWRDKFNTEFDFYYAQIAPFMHYQNDDGVKVRDAQRRALDRISNSAMVVLSDIGDTTDIHPRKKIDAGKRFAQVALNKTYGYEEYPVSGPLFKDYLIKENKIEVLFDYSDGLYCSDKKLTMFELAGEDLQWYPAKAVIKQGKVVVSSGKVSRPVHVRFAWTNAATPNLFNKYNLPASGFTTLEWRNVKHSL